MRLSVSNLAIPAAAGRPEWRALAEAGVQGVEVAPTRWAPWADLDAPCLARHRAEIEAEGLRVSSLQAIFFGVDGLSLLGPREAFELMLSHTARLGAVGAALGAGVAVFGAPRQRARGGLSPKDAVALGTERLHALAATAWKEGVCIGLEPVPADYGNDFLPSWQEVLAMVQAIGHPGLRVHLDVSCVTLGGGGIAEAVRVCAPFLVHYHAAEPKLAAFSSPVAPHAAASEALALSGYQGWVAIEMLEQADAPMSALLEAVAFVRRRYAV